MSLAPTSTSVIGNNNFNLTGTVVVLPTATTNAAPYVVSLSQSGSIIKVPIMPQAATLTLPPVASALGFTLKLMCSGVPAYIVRLDAGAGNMNANQLNNATWSSTQNGRYHQFTDIAPVGALIELTCDGTSYHSHGFSTLAGGIGSA